MYCLTIWFEKWVNSVKIPSCFLLLLLNKAIAEKWNFKVSFFALFHNDMASGFLSSACWFVDRCMYSHIQYMSLQNGVDESSTVIHCKKCSKITDREWKHNCQATPVRKWVWTVNKSRYSYSQADSWVFRGLDSLAKNTTFRLWNYKGKTVNIRFTFTVYPSLLNEFTRHTGHQKLNSSLSTPN